MKKHLPLFAILLALFLFAACGDDDDDDNDDAASDDDTGDDDAAGDDDAGGDDDDIGDDDDDDDGPPPEAIDCGATFTRLPYLQLATQTSMNVLWRTDAPGDSLVEWGETDALGRFAYEGEQRLVHEMYLGGLKPGTTYHYRVRSCTEESSVATFRTAPEAGTPFSFAGIADNQAGWETFSQIVPLMLDTDPWLVMHAGDCVDHGWTATDFEEQLFGPGAELWRKAPLYVAIGNHEGNAPMFYESFHFPNDDRPFFSFTYGNVFFVGLALDTAHISIPGTPQYEFFIETMSSGEAAAADFRVVFFHTPPYTEGWDSYDGDWIARMVFLPAMEALGVDVYFNGHTHDYERGYLNGVTSYIIGGAGGGLDSWARDVPHITVYEARHHFVNVTVDGPSMTIDAIGLDGEIFDTNTITAK